VTPWIVWKGCGLVREDPPDRTGGRGGDDSEQWLNSRDFLRDEIFESLRRGNLAGGKHGFSLETVEAACETGSRRVEPAAAGYVARSVTRGSSSRLESN
jgi:hypothetical protein